MGVMQYEKKRTRHKAEAWTKIHFWLDEHKEVSVHSTSPSLSFSIILVASRANFVVSLANVKELIQIDLLDCSLFGESRIASC